MEGTTCLLSLYDKDRTENALSKNSSIVTYAFVTTATFSQNRCLAERWSYTYIYTLMGRIYELRRQYQIEARKTKQTSWFLVRKRNMPTERPPRVGEC
jgi:hypothetical protein